MLSLLGRQGASEEERRHFRKVSKIVMKSVDLLTFNGRTIPLFLIALTGRFELYFLYEIIFLNIILVLSIAQHEELCRWTIERISQQKIPCPKPNDLISVDELSKSSTHFWAPVLEKC